MKRAISLILVALMMLLAVPAFSVTAADGTAKSDYVVYLNGTAGADAHDGKTAATAVATFVKAVELACAYTDVAEVVIVVTGDTSLGNIQHNILPENKARICVTGYYDGTNYNGKLITNTDNPVSVLYLNGDYTFEYLTLDCRRDNFILCMQYNNVKIGHGMTVVPLESRKDIYSAFPILLVGCNGDTSAMHDKAIGDPTFTNDVLVEVYSGEWQYFRAGDRDAKTTFDGNMTIKIDGIKTKIPASDTSYISNNNNNSPTGKGSYGPNAKIVMDIGNVELNNLVGITYVQPNSGNTNKADVTLNIREGVKTGRFCAVQKNALIFDGKLTVNVYGGDFSELLTVSFANNSIANGGTGTVTINHNPADPASVAAFNALKDKAADAGDASVTYGEIKAETVVDTTEVVVTTEATVDTTAAVVDTTAAVVDTTAATGEVTPPTGDASLMVVFAAAAVLCAAAVIVIKKREN